MATTSHYPEGVLPAPEDFLEVLTEVVDALETGDVDFALMGGIGNAAVARPRATDDIDVFVREEGARAALDALAETGFETEEYDPFWLYKARKRGVLVDIIFRSTGDIYLDDEMLRRTIRVDYKGRKVPVVSPEDLLVIKATASGEAVPHHWYDALGIVARCNLDWPYVISRARASGPRRVLSLLLYAESVDLAVPTDAVEQLFATVHPPATT